MAFTFALTRSDAEEATARQRAADMGLLGGGAKEVEPAPTIRGVIDSIRHHHARER
jgi:hypothetical protein